MLRTTFRTTVAALFVVSALGTSGLALADIAPPRPTDPGPADPQPADASSVPWAGLRGQAIAVTGAGITLLAGMLAFTRRRQTAT